MAPVVALIAVFTKTANRRTALISSLIIMLIGTISTYAALEPDVAATTHLTSDTRALVEGYRELAALMRSSFTLTTLLFGLKLILCGYPYLGFHGLTGVLPLATAVF